MEQPTPTDVLENEVELVELAKKDDAAFETLYNHYFPKIYGYVYKRTGNKEVAEDIVSATFLRVFTNLHKYTHKGHSFGSWVYKIATNKLIDHYRKTGKQKHVDIEGAGPIVDDNASPEVHVEIKIRGEDVRAVLCQISPKYQHILHLKFFGELKNTEIAEVLGISPNNAGVLLHRALKQFQKKYQSYGR